MPLQQSVRSAAGHGSNFTTKSHIRCSFSQRGKWGSAGSDASRAQNPPSNFLIHNSRQVVWSWNPSEAAKSGSFLQFCAIKVSVKEKQPIEEFMFRIPTSWGLIYIGAVYGAKQSLLFLLADWKYLPGLSDRICFDSEGSETFWIDLILIQYWFDSIYDLIWYKNCEQSLNIIAAMLFEITDKIISDCFLWIFHFILSHFCIFLLQVLVQTKSD